MIPITRIITAVLIVAGMLPVAATAQCVCAIQSASPSLTFEGRPLPASLPCGSRIQAADKGELVLAGGMRLSLGAGASLALPAAVCGKEGGEPQSAAVSGVVRMLSGAGQTVNLGDSVPAAVRGGEKEGKLAVIVRLEGTVELRGKGEPPMPAKKDMALGAGESLRTGDDGFAELILGDGSRVLVGPKQNFDPASPLQ